MLWDGWRVKKKKKKKKKVTLWDVKECGTKKKRDFTFVK